jgi:O-antigen biosynthesis protein
MNKRVAIVVPRYGLDVAGGAARQARCFAEEAARQGWRVEVWTTRANNLFTWEDAYPAGCEEIHSVTVRRFPAAWRNRHRHVSLDNRLVWQGHIPMVNQYEWLETGVHSVSLYAHVAQHAAEFNVIVALPFTMPLVHYAAWTAPGRVVVWPCLHDEPHAYTEPVRLLLENVWGVMFNSPEEGALAIRRLGIRPRRAVVLGEGVSLNLPVSGSPDDDLSLQTRNLLYVGRLEVGKNVKLLYDYVRCYADEEGGDVRLVVLGRGPLEPPDHPAFDYRGFAPEEEKALACASSLALCQPSINESFSLTIMESWLAGRPVIVNDECAVTRGHVRRSKGGLWFHSYEEFIGAVKWIQKHTDLADQMGENGRQYVLENYQPEKVVARFGRVIRRWQEEDA